MSEKMPWQMTRTEWESEIQKAQDSWGGWKTSRHEMAARLRFLRCGLLDTTKYDEMLRHHNMIAE